MSKQIDSEGNAIRTFQISSNNPQGGIEVKITEPNLTADNLPLETWASSWVMASQLHKLDIKMPSRTSATELGTSNGDGVTASDEPVAIIELGAGTGLVGLTAAHEWNAPVILTDLAPIVPGLQANISLNERLLSSCSKASATCGTLDWNDPTALTLSDGTTTISSRRKATVLLAADTVYSEEHPELLEKVVVEWLARTPEARFVITYAMRVAYLDEIRAVWERLENAGLVAVEEGQRRAGEGMFDDEGLCEWSVWKWKDLSSS
ncbi:hypothetical protein AAFC00_006731 [Neodothiora populina]|uniref:Uncharacterized protein n=1 Tax=Neodothiora populina TaxID=2781224 RepID=A0ABR3PAZ3_9PEZI